MAAAEQLSLQVGVRRACQDLSVPVHLNLARRMRLSGINQLWAADITFVRLQQEIVYVAVILDAYSRKVVGWAGKCGRPS